MQSGSNPLGNQSPFIFQIIQFFQNYEKSTAAIHFDHAKQSTLNKTLYAFPLQTIPTSM